jgi:hypothetical protein
MPQAPRLQKGAFEAERISRFQRSIKRQIGARRPVGPGYYISRLRRSEHASDLIDESDNVSALPKREGESKSR